MLLASLLALAGPTASADTARYCEPEPRSKLLYTDRAYLILDTPKDAPPFQYSYVLLPANRRVDRIGHMLSGEEGKAWSFAGNPREIAAMWPLRPDATYRYNQIDGNGGTVAVSLTVLGIEPIALPAGPYTSWKVRRVDIDPHGGTFVQFLWYAPELCALSAFTNSRHAFIRLLRILRPGDRDYDRPLARRHGHLIFTDTGELVR